jgi:hypothetical protein
MAGIMPAMLRGRIRLDQRLAASVCWRCQFLDPRHAGLAWRGRLWRPPPTGAHGALLGFFLYSVTIIAALWSRPGVVLRLKSVFALLLVRFTGGAGSTIFLALLLIAGLAS